MDAMSDIVLDLRRRNWSNEKIGRELGMDPDEVLRLTQISGLAEMFAETNDLVAGMPSRKSKRKVPVKRIKLPKTGVVRVIVPPGVAPVVAITEKAIDIVPAESHETWWEGVKRRFSE